MLYNYSVTPLKEDHFEERVKDIVDMHRNGVITMPLFSMTLVPEGDPVWDKATPMCKLYAKYRDALDKEGIPSGILVQASLGHGYVLTPNPFTRYVNLIDGEEAYVCCPEDQRFVEHFCGVLKQLAAEHPKAIMLDDDFRLIIRPGRGCTCHRHMAEFNRLAGTNMTREELYRHLLDCPKNDRLSRIFGETQTNTLVKTAKAFRSAIDEVDPTIQGINCTSGHMCDSVMYTNKIIAGEGHPTMVRVPNGIYAPRSVRGFSDLMRQAAICKSKLKKHGIEILLAETDTIPYNRYAKSARYLHSHYVASMLDGLKGAKHWLCRGSAFEPRSGVAYRKILAEHKEMYEKLSELSDGISWIGCNSFFTEQTESSLRDSKYSRYHDGFWITENIERMGLPFYFSEDVGAANFIEGNLVAGMTDEQIKELFKGNVFTDGECAAELVRRGYGDLLGVNVEEWDDGNVSGECFDENGVIGCTAQKNLKKLTVTDKDTEVLSYNYRREREGATLLAPAVTKYKRPDGGMTVVFCGSPLALFKYTEGFAFLNESRKAQLVSLLSEAGALPVYTVGDEEICLRAGYLKDGGMIVAMYEIGIDPLDEIVMHFEKAPESIELMMPDGSNTPVEFASMGDGNYCVKVRVESMYPVILTVK